MYLLYLNYILSNISNYFVSFAFWHNIFTNSGAFGYRHLWRSFFLLHPPSWNNRASYSEQPLKWFFLSEYISAPGPDTYCLPALVRKEVDTLLWKISFHQAFHCVYTRYRTTLDLYETLSILINGSWRDTVDSNDLPTFDIRLNASDWSRFKANKT